MIERKDGTMENLHCGNTTIEGGFWKYYTDLDRNVTVKSVYDRFLETGRFDALKCNWREGMPNKPHMFWDSDVAKWIEGAAYLIEKEPMPEIESRIDEMIDLIEKNQRADGYFNSYFLTVTPSEIYTNRGWHELYCTGHFVEAAIAYHRATGKRKLLDCMLKSVDCVYRVFIEEKSAHFVTPGHQEIELALLKLYRYLGNPKHLELAKYFIDKRGNNEIEERTAQRTDDVAARDIHEAVGHCVRAGYYYSAMATLSKLTDDAELLAACKRVYDDITLRKMSITGSIGAEHNGERFSYPYDLPPSDTYNETCAAIGLAFFGSYMQEIEADSRYGDLVERIIYNGFLSGISLAGDEFFYTNPTEVDQKKFRRSTFQPAFDRVKVFNCSCCPPNVVRLLASISRFMYTQDGDTVYCNQFAESSTELVVGGEKAYLRQKTDYPFDGKITFSYSGKPIKLYVRIPAWCVEYEGETQNGFVCFELEDGDSVTLDLPMEVHLMEANPHVQDVSGKYAVMRGPIVYCMEGHDNGEDLRDITILENGTFRTAREDGIPAPVLYADAERRLPSTALYSIKNGKRTAFTARLIPYFAFSNRGKTDMLIWTMAR